MRVERERCTLDDPSDDSCFNAHLVHRVVLTSHVLQHECAPLDLHTRHAHVLRGGVYCCTDLSLVLQHESCAHLDNSSCLCLVPLIFSTMKKPKGDFAATYSRVLQLRSETNAKPPVFQYLLNKSAEYFHRKHRALESLHRTYHFSALHKQVAVSSICFNWNWIQLHAKKIDKYFVLLRRIAGRKCCSGISLVVVLLRRICVA